MNAADVEDRKSISSDFDELTKKMNKKRSILKKRNEEHNIKLKENSDDLRLNILELEPPTTSKLKLEDGQKTELVRELKDENGRLSKLVKESELEMNLLRKKLEEKTTIFKTTSSLSTNSGHLSGLPGARAKGVQLGEMKAPIGGMSNTNISSFTTNKARGSQINVEAAMNKIVDLSKRLRDMNSQLESEKNKNREVVEQCDQLQEMVSYIEKEKNELLKEPNEKEVDTLKKRLKQIVIKTCEYRNENQSLRSDLRALQNLLNKDTGQQLSIPMLIKSSSNKTGKNQEIFKLRQKVASLKRQLNEEKNLRNREFKTHFDTEETGGYQQDSANNSQFSRGFQKRNFSPSFQSTKRNEKNDENEEDKGWKVEKEDDCFYDVKEGDYDNNGGDFCGANSRRIINASTNYRERNINRPDNKSTIKERQKKNIRMLEINKQIQIEKIMEKLNTLKEENSSIKQKLEGFKARNQILSKDMKENKLQLDVLTEKGKNDDEMIELLLNQQNHLKHALTVNLKKAPTMLELKNCFIKQSDVGQLTANQKQKLFNQLEDNRLGYCGNNHLNQQQLAKKGNHQLFKQQLSPQEGYQFSYQEGQQEEQILQNQKFDYNNQQSHLKSQPDKQMHRDQSISNSVPFQIPLNTQISKSIHSEKKNYFPPLLDQISQKISPLNTNRNIMKDSGKERFSVSPPSNSNRSISRAVSTYKRRGSPAFKPVIPSFDNSIMYSKSANYLNRTSNNTHITDTGLIFNRIFSEEDIYKKSKDCSDTGSIEKNNILYQKDINKLADVTIGKEKISYNEINYDGQSSNNPFDIESIYYAKNESITNVMKRDIGVRKRVEADGESNEEECTDILSLIPISKAKDEKLAKNEIFSLKNNNADKKLSNEDTCINPMTKIGNIIDTNIVKNTNKDCSMTYINNEINNSINKININKENVKENMTSKIDTDYFKSSPKISNINNIREDNDNENALNFNNLSQVYEMHDFENSLIWNDSLDDSENNEYGNIVNKESIISVIRTCSSNAISNDVKNDIKHNNNKELVNNFIPKAIICNENANIDINKKSETIMENAELKLPVLEKYDSKNQIEIDLENGQQFLRKKLSYINCNDNLNEYDDENVNNNNNNNNLNINKISNNDNDISKNKNKENKCNLENQESGIEFKHRNQLSNDISMIIEYEKFLSLYQVCKVEKDKMVEFVKVLQKNISDLSLDLAEVNGKYLGERKRNVTLEKNMTVKHITNAMINCNAPATHRIKASENGYGNGRTKSEVKNIAISSNEILEEVQLKLEIQRDENDALKKALESCLRGKEDDLTIYQQLLQKTKFVFTETINRLKNNI